jgi:hypothetical protein
MGVVVAARHLLLDTDVALKFLLTTEPDVVAVLGVSAAGHDGNYDEGFPTWFVFVPVTLFVALLCQPRS